MGLGGVSFFPPLAGEARRGMRKNSIPPLIPPARGKIMLCFLKLFKNILLLINFFKRGEF